MLQLKQVFQQHKQILLPIKQVKQQSKLFKGDKIKISPNQDYTPYTEEKEAYLRVCVRSCDNLIDIVCK